MRLHLVQNICWLGFLIVGAAISSVGQCSFSKPSSDTVLTYKFEPQIEGQKMSLHVTLEFNGGANGRRKLVLPSEWAGQRGLERSIGELKPISPTTSIADTNLPDEKLVSFPPNTEVRLSYLLVKDWGGPLNSGTRFRADLSPSYFHLVGTSSLVHPKLDDLQTVDVRFDWQKLPATWSLATSFGTEDRCQSFHGMWHDALNSLFVGGDYRTYRTELSGKALNFAIRGKWSFSDDQWIEKVRKIVEFERGFWHDNNFPYLLVTLTPLDQDTGSTGGTALTDALMMHLSRQDQLQPNTVGTVAHEVFHLWNPGKIGSRPGSDYPVSWFFEGFTFYYQEVMLFRAGMIDFPGLVAAVNGKLRSYDTSDGVNVSLYEFIRRHSTDYSVLNQLDDRRGAVLALWLDATIRAKTNNKSSLDDLMFRLADQDSSYERRHDGKPEPLTNERIYRATSELIGWRSTRLLRAFVEQGGIISIPTDALGPCVRSSFERVPQFDLGFDFASLRSPKRIVSGVESTSQAYKAGLRDGQQLIGWSIYNGDTSKEVRLTIKESGGKRVLAYYPRGGEISVQQFVLNQERFSASPKTCAFKN